MTNRMLLMVVALAVSPVLAQFCAPLEAGLQMTDCHNNTYTINVPEQCAVGNDTCGMIFGIHGWMQNPDEQDRNTRMRALGEANDYVVVQPMGNPVGINFGNFEVVFPGFVERDDGNVYQTLLDLRDDLQIDPLRIHVNGFSQGAWLTWRMICNQADLWPEPRSVIASFGPMSAGIGGSPTGGSALNCFGPNDIGGNSTAILYFHGVNDDTVSFTEAENAIAAITEAIGDNATVERIDGNDFFERTRREGNGLIFETIIHQQGHCVIGRTEGDCNSVGSPSFTAGEELMAFFMAHPFMGEPNLGGGGAGASSGGATSEDVETAVEEETPTDGGEDTTTRAGEGEESSTVDEDDSMSGEEGSGEGSQEGDGGSDAGSGSNSAQAASNDGVTPAPRSLSLVSLGAFLVLCVQ